MSDPPPTELDRLRAILETQRVITAHIHAPQRVMDVVAEHSQGLTGAAGAVVELLEGDEMVYRAASGTAAASLGVRLSAATSLSGRCVAEGRPLECTDSETDDRVDHDACRRVGVRSMIVVPLRLADDRCVGVLKVLSPEVAAFGDEDLELLQTMAEFIATSLQLAAEFQDRDRRASSDALTGLANRTVLLDRIATALARSRRSAAPVTLAFMDLDGFKAVNDELGHDAGDHVLIEIAEALVAAVRAEDTVARLGGDEFVVLLEGLEASVMDDLVERLVAQVERSWTPPSGGPGVSVSVGISRSEAHDTAETLLAGADSAMYARKRERRSARP